MRRVLQRRAGARLLIGTGVAMLALAVLPVVTASAAEEAGSGFSSFALAANAPAMQFRQVENTQCGGEPASTGGCEAVVPEAVSTLRSGPIGYALSSVVWPGVLAGNAGSLIIVAGGEDVPPEARQLNSPVRAEARSGGDDKEVVNDDYPGTRMVAFASNDKVSAEATLANGAATPAGTSGESTGRTSTYLTGARTATSEAYSQVKDVSIAAGVVKIGSVTSQAKATTDGVKADATGQTVTSGITIGGIPVTVDEKGVSVNGNNAPVNSAATAIVNTAISNAGMTIAVSQPQKFVEGSTVTYDSGSLIFYWEQQEGFVMTAVFGGTRVSATATPAFDAGGGTGGGTTGTTTGTVVPPVPGTVVEPPVVPVTDPGAPAPAAPGPTVAPVAGGFEGVPVGERRALPGGLSAGLVLFGLVGSGLVAAGFRRLPDRVLEAPVTACPLESTP
jgi:hypothetical protein